MKRTEELKSLFHEVYPDAGAPRVCRAPGRINLLGEHVDYSGLPVLPMAINRDIRIAFAPRKDSLVRMQDREAAFPPREFQNGAEIERAPGQWDNYCRAAVQGLNLRFRPVRFPGMDMFVSGDVPVAVGLSSSSALVVACAMAYLACLDKELGRDISRLELATLLAEAEQFVGTRGGGMDQAIILLGAEGAACKIDFFPLRAEAAPLFEDCMFVACNSLVKAEKTGEALHRYNAGPLTCRLVRALVERQAREDFAEDLVLDRLADLWYGPLALTHEEGAALVERTFTKERYTLFEVAALLAMTPGEVRARWLGDLLEPADGFPLKARARHQLSEFRRVEAARDLLHAGDAPGFGRLMDASHASCAGDYQVSCPELDALVTAAREAGALGARLTGAGFGGCTVNLVPRERLEAFQAGVERMYYEEHVARANSAAPGQRAAASTNGRILVAQASAGANYL